MFTITPADATTSPSDVPRARAISTKTLAQRESERDASIKVLCVDDHEALTHGLSARFELDRTMCMVGRLGSADRLLEEIAKLHPNLVILDIEMPGRDVFEMADRMHHMYPNLRFVFLSAHIKDGYMAAAFRCGASGYLAKADDLDSIVACLKEVAHSRHGTFVMGPKVKVRFAQPLVASPTTRSRPCRHEPIGNSTNSHGLQSLTAREIEVLRLIGKGLSRNEIATELSRSAKTIDGHQERIMRKLMIDTRTDLIRFAIREGFAEA